MISMWSYHDGASTTKQRIAYNFLQKYVPSVGISSFDSEFNSAPNGGTFIHGTYFVKILPIPLFFSYIEEENPDKIFPKYVPWIKVPPFDAELNFESNELIPTDGTYFYKKL